MLHQRHVRPELVGVQLQMLWPAMRLRSGRWARVQLGCSECPHHTHNPPSSGCSHLSSRKLSACRSSWADAPPVLSLRGVGAVVKLWQRCMPGGLLCKMPMRPFAAESPQPVALDGGQHDGAVTGGGHHDNIAIKLKMLEMCDGLLVWPEPLQLQEMLGPLLSSAWPEYGEIPRLDVALCIAGEEPLVFRAVSVQGCYCSCLHRCDTMLRRGCRSQELYALQELGCLGGPKPCTAIGVHCEEATFVLQVDHPLDASCHQTHVIPFETQLGGPPAAAAALAMLSTGRPRGLWVHA
mmetsp:Transcript_48743/g.112970  ORF Transcript_48743/g.112970 Transcript_48743/m.112970 type:complete len:294 (+) Transcript_48743:68-949(+)